MTSVCVKNVGTSPEKLSSPASHLRKTSKTREESQPLENEEEPVDFEFLLEDPVTMLTADELFSDGKLVPLKFSAGNASNNPEEEEKAPVMISTVNTAEKQEQQPCHQRRLEMEIDPYLFSPRAPRCTVRWRELLGLKRLTKTPEEALSSRLSSSTPNPKTSSFRHFLNRGSKSTPSPVSSPPPPPLDVSESSSSASLSSSRLSLSSSSSSGHELDDVPRLSLDLDKPNNAPNPFARSRAHHHLRSSQQRKPRRCHDHETSTECGGNCNETRALTVTADSPRLNASGKIVFHGLERSSSSPGNFTGGPRMKQHHGMPRSQSAHVRITPVLNVPVSSLRGGGPKSGLFFGQLFTSSSSSSSANRAAQLQSNTTKNRTNRTRLEPTSEL